MDGYILIDRGEAAKAVLDGVMQLAWGNGRGRILVGASGSRLVRGPIDVSVYPGSRLIYEAPVVFGRGPDAAAARVAPFTLAACWKSTAFLPSLIARRQRRLWTSS